MSRAQVTLTAGPAEVGIEPDDGGRITSLCVWGHELLGRVGARVTEHGCFVMAPWAGRIRDGLLVVDGATYRLPTDRTHPHAGHGLVLDRPWQVDARSESSATLRCELDSRWPFPGEVVQVLTLDAGALHQTLRVHSYDEPFPATVGWHPWFRRELDAGGPVEPVLRAGVLWRRDAAGIPDGTLVPAPPGPWDDCFSAVTWPVVLRWPGALTLQIDADTADVVIFDERPDTICIEPQTGPPDGPNLCPRLVTPDEPLVATTTWRWSRHRAPE
jgi:aldose 1-epimerase